MCAWWVSVVVVGWWVEIKNRGRRTRKAAGLVPGGLSEGLCVSLVGTYGESSERGRVGRFLRSNTMKVAGLAIAPCVQVEVG